MTDSLRRLATTIRMLSADAVEKANSGHPGMPMGTADIASVLWSSFLRFNPQQPSWINRDRFVLSAGHGSMLLYSMLHLFGYDLSLEEIKNFRQWESKTPGHPEFGLTPGVETTTGPLGQGFANGVGIALSGKLLKERYGSDLFSYRVFGIVSDGDLMEGVSCEAASLAGHLGLSNLVYIYDDNDISIGGSTNVCFTESVDKRFESYNWFVQRIDGHNFNEIKTAIDKALAEKDRPSIICARTTIGFGSPNKANDAEVHGAPLGEKEIALTRENLGWPADARFFVPDDVKSYCKEVIARRKDEFAAWEKSYKSWEEKNSELAKALKAQISRSLPATLKSELIQAFADPKKDATRNLSGKAIQVIAKSVPGFIGGSADLEPSTKTLIKDAKDIGPKEFSGKNIRFGVREHAMGAVANGLAYSQCWFPYTATFLVFSDYMRPSIRLAAISHLQTLFIFTHDSFWVGEDGPTHEPIEHIQSLRIIPNLYVFRPADGLETAMCYFGALELKNRPSALLFTRQNLPPLERPKGFVPEDVLKGGYLVKESTKPTCDLVIVATGSEVWVASEAADSLEKKGISTRVVSMPCVEKFKEQSSSYKDSLIPLGAKKVSLEAGITVGWEEIVGADALRIGIDHYGASAPGELLAKKFGFTPDSVSDKIGSWLSK